MRLPAPYGKYELLELIATGGMAEVFLARSFGVAGFEKRLVIKRIRPELAQDPRFVSMFINEAKISVHLNHPNVVQTYDLGRVGSSYYIAMEHLHGRDLNKLVKVLRQDGRRLPLPLAVHIVAEAARGLGYAHARTDARGELLGLVHRDVSPHNLLLTFSGEVKLVDFGIARLMNSARAEPAAPGRPGGGKYAYMSPEQAWGETADRRTDIFSAGIVLWELIVGHRLYQDPDPQEKLRRVRAAEIPHPREQGSDIDDELWSVLQRALARERDDRYPTAELFEEDLRAWLYTHARCGPPDVVQTLRDAFPHESAGTGAELDLRQIVADVGRMDAGDRSASGATYTQTATPMPGRLRASQGERKRVAALVVDMDGLTELSARVEPEELFKNHYRLLRWMRGIVDRHGGLVQRVVDDQVLVLFGAERTREDDVERALSCAADLQRRVTEMRVRGLHVHLAIGAHGGEVTVGAPAGRHVRYVARGDTTRLARKLSALADHGQTLVSEAVVRQVDGRFRFRRGPNVACRGGGSPASSWILDGAAGAHRAQVHGPWVRRGRELDAVREGLAALADRRGSAMVLVGEVGAGKSRLVRELAEVAARRHLSAWVARCTAFGEDPTMAPVRELVFAVLGVASDAPADDLRSQLPRLSQLGLTAREIAALAAITGVGELRPGQRTDAWSALRHMIAGLAEDRPVIVAFEDLHHLDARSRDRLRGVVSSLADRPVMFLLTHRLPLPDDLRDIGPTVTLGPFQPSVQRRLLAYLLDAQEVHEDLWALVDRTCEGNPLYIEEMVKYLQREHRVDVHNGEARLANTLKVSDLPSSLTAFVAARIDALDAASKGTLQLAALLGMEFSAQLLADAAGVDDATPLIHDLAGHNLVVRDEGDHDRWRITSELVREAALRGILRIQRADYHRLIASAIETRYADGLDAWMETLAHHCAAGGRLIDAARYAHRLGAALEQAHQLGRARSIYARALQWVRRVPDADSWEAKVQGEATIALRLGSVELLLGDLGAGVRALQLALDIAADSGLPWIEVRAHLELGRAYVQRGRLRLAAAHLDQATALHRLDEEPAVALDLLETRAHLAHELGDNDQAEALWREAHSLASGDDKATARCLLGLATRFLRQGALDRAQPLLTEALTAAEQAGDRILQGRVLNNTGLMHATAGRHDEAIAYLRRALRVREGIGYTRGIAVNHHNIGDVWFSRGDRARAHVAFTRSRELAARMDWERGVVLNDVFLGYLDAIAGRPEGAARIDAATRRARELGDTEIATTGGWLAGRYLVETEEVERGVARLREALADAERYQLGTMAKTIAALIEHTRT